MTRQYKTTQTAECTVREYIETMQLTAKRRYRVTWGQNTFEKFLGRTACLQDLNDNEFERFSRWLPTTQLSGVIHSEMMATIVQIARHAAERSLIQWPSPKWKSRRKYYRLSTGDPSKLSMFHYYDEVFLAAKEESLSPETLKAYRSAIRAYERFCLPGCVLISKVSPQSLRRFRQWLIDRGVSKKKAGNHTFAVACVAKHASPTRFSTPKEAGRPPSLQSRRLEDVFQTRFLAAQMTITCDATIRKYVAAIDSFGRFLGHIPTLDDLMDENVGGWMRSERKRGLAIVTVNGYKDKLVCLWKYCARKRFVDEFPNVGEMPEPKKTPTSWTEEELIRLFCACSRMAGEVSGIPAPLWWETLHLVAWDSGARKGELFNLRWEMLNWKTGILSVPAEFRKGRREPKVYDLSADTIHSLRQMKSPKREAVFPFDRHSGVYYHRYKTLLKFAGLPYERYRSGLQKVRRSFATHLERLGGDATEALSHSERGLTVAHYLDPRFKERTPPNRILFRLNKSPGCDSPNESK